MKDVNDNPRGPSVLEQALEPSYCVTERSECKSDGCSRPAVMESVDEAEGELRRKEQSLKASQKTAVLGWPPPWNGLIPGHSMYLFVLSQILLLCMMLWYSTYGTIPAAQNAFDLLAYLLTPFKQAFSGESLTTVGSVVVSYILLSLASLGLLFVGSLFWHLLRAPPDPPFPLQEDRRQSVSRQPSFTYSEWTEDKNEDDFLDLDPVPETPVFDCVMDIKAETDPATLTVKSVGLQERRGSNVSLTLDMCTPGCSEQGFGYVMSPREQSAREYLQTASNILTEEELHKKALDPFILQAEFFEIPMNFVDPKEYDIPGLVRKNRYKTILPNPHSRVCLTSADQDDPLSKNYINIECIECCGKNLYIGTNDCFIYHFLLDEKVSTAGKITFAATKQLHKYLGLKKPVSELKAASALTRLLVLCDNTITLVNMINLEPVPTGARIKGAVTFTLNENPVSGDPFCVEVCIISVKRRTIQMFMVFEDRVQIVKEVFTPEQPCAVAVDGYYLCLALTTQYIILNYNTGVSQDLFPYCSDEKRPIVKRIGRQEFLLAGPGGLGMFATVDGISQRAPVHWSENVIGAALCFPYVVALDDEFITVHSMLDQQQKQTLPFKEGHILQDFEGKVIVATNKGVYILVPLPLEKQIQDLLAGHRVEEALVLAKGARRNIPKEKFQVMYKRILQQAGFIQFAQLQFLEAKELFRSGQLDVRELISLYPFLLPTSSSFIRSHPPLHEYADLNQLTQGDQEKMTKCKRFLMSYLNEVRSTEVANGYKEDIDTALLKLYAEANHESLLDLLVSENFCLLTDSAAWLEKHKKYFALGLLYHYNGQDAAALQLWVKIVDGDIQDSTRSDLYDYIVDFLTFCSDQELVWKYSEWILQKNEEVGVQIFTKRPLEEQEKNNFNPDDIISCLNKYPKARVKYLEHLVLERKIQKEKYHTHLAVLYLEAILQLKSVTTDNCTETTELLLKLRSLLQKSDLYRIRFILDKIQGTDLHMESAILYGKLEEHEKALHILVHELKDFHAAEEYCVWNSENRDLQYRRRLFHMLLSVYLTPGTSDCALVMAAVDLLNNHAAEFDAGLVLQVVPDSWSVQLLSPFLAGAVRQSIHTKRMTQVALGLAQAENLIYKHEKVKQKGAPILLSDKKVCQVCQNPFCEPVFVRYPNGSVAHTHCAANRHPNSNVTHHSPSSSNQT